MARLGETRTGSNTDLWGKKRAVSFGLLKPFRAIRKTEPPDTKMKTIVSIVTLALGFAASAPAAILDLGSFAGHRYFYDPGSFTSLDGARLGAQAQGAELVSITSAAENDFLISTINSLAASNLRAAWIGLSRPTPADPFAWDSGETFAYDNWRPAGGILPYPEPTGETATVFYVNDPAVAIGYWADTYNSSAESFNAIYEVVPEPTTTSFLGLAAIGWLTMNRRRRIITSGGLPERK